MVLEKEQKKKQNTHTQDLCKCCFNVLFFSFCEQDCHDGVLWKEWPLPWCILRAILFQVIHSNSASKCVQKCFWGFFFFSFFIYLPTDMHVLLERHIKLRNQTCSCKSCVSPATKGLLPVPQHVLRDSHGAPHPSLRPRQRLRADRVEGAGLPCAWVSAHHSQLLLVPHLQTGWRRPSLSPHLQHSTEIHIWIEFFWVNSQGNFFFFFRRSL